MPQMTLESFGRSSLQGSVKFIPCFAKELLSRYRARTDHEKTLIQRQIESADQQIDRLVYDLYGLTEAEIKLV
jgi:hypothetical protein